MQTEHLGWHTDDFLIVGQNGAGARRKLAGQVKRTFRVSAANEECRKAIGDFWRDFTGDGLSLDLHTATRQTEAAIKTLLAHTAAGSDASTVADASWNELLAIASDAMATERSFQRNDLPESLRQRHSAVGGPEHKVLHALKEHTDIVLKGIRSTIGNQFHFPRSALVQDVLGRLESTQVVVVSGPAGIGKSAVVLDAIAFLSGDHFAFGFRAEEFAQPHLDAALQNGQIPANAATLRAILASQHRKVLLIESVERLLEKSTRDAFSDLLKLAAADESLRIVLTCRDYSTDLVRAAFLASAPLEPTGYGWPSSSTTIAVLRTGCSTRSSPTTAFQFDSEMTRSSRSCAHRHRQRSCTDMSSSSLRTTENCSGT